ncbi:putative dynamin stalk domain, Dynamin superfamily [Helianthus annuus]|nr:putative dynamin stalk domain, Dynamin superfamily [Helianthus annuus]
MGDSKSNIPHLFKEISKRMKEPLQAIKELSHMNVLAKNPSFSNVYEPLLKIVLLDEASARSRVMRALLGLGLPSEVSIPVVLKFKSDYTLPSRKIFIQFRYKNYYSVEEEVVEGDVESAVSRELKKVQEELEKEKQEQETKQVEKIERSIEEFIFTVVQPLVGDFTVICLPEICKEDDREKNKVQIGRFQGYIQEYVEDLQCVFLNLLSCSSNMETSLSKDILFGFDRQGTRTLRVFTDLGLSSDYMTSQLTSLSIGHPTIKDSPNRFGFFFIQDDLETRKEEESANKQSIILSRLGKAYVGFENISKHIVLILLSMIFSPSSELIMRIDSDLRMSENQIERTRERFTSVTDAMLTILTVVSSATASLTKLFLVRDYVEYQQEHDMHAASDLVCRFALFRKKMMDLEQDTKHPFLYDEISLVDDRYTPDSADYVSPTVGKALLAKRFSYAADTLEKCVSEILDYVELVVITVLMDHSKEYQQLNPYLQNIGKMWIEDLEEQFRKKLEELINLEKSFIYTCKEDYHTKVNEMKMVKFVIPEGNPIEKVCVNIDGIGENIRVDHLRGYPPSLLEKAFDLRKQMTVYWKYTIERLIDNCMLNFHVIISKMLEKGIQTMVYKTRSMLQAMEPKMGYDEATLKYRIEYLKGVKKNIKRWQSDFAFLFWQPALKPEVS